MQIDIRSVVATDDISKLRIAFLGGGHDSAVGRAHRTAIEADGRFELVAGAFSRNAEKSATTARQYGIDTARAYDNLSRLLDQEKGNIDVIAILTPQQEHAQQVLACLDAGVPVICEKALAATAAEAATIQDRLTARHGFLVVTYNYLGYPMVRELKSMIANGRLGDIQQIHMEMPQEGFARLTSEGQAVVPQQWRLHDGEIPTLSLDLGVHLHMLARFLTGQSPLEVTAIANSFGNFSQVVDNVSCLVRYSGGAVGNIWYGKTAFGYRNGLKLRVLGTKGAAEWVQEKPEYLDLADNVGNKFLVDRGSPNIKVATQTRYQRFKVGHPAGFIEAFANYYSDIANVLSGHLSGEPGTKSEYVFGIREALEGLRFLEAIARSSLSAKWEKIS
jgi:predicted dehydrogenase